MAFPRIPPCQSIGLSALLAALLLAAPHPAVQADTVSLNPVADATLIETEPDNSLGGHGFFNAGTTGIGTQNRGLIRFDLSSVIPPGSIIESASVHLTVVFIPSSQVELSLFGLHRVLQPWGEGNNVPATITLPGLGAPADLNDATWNDRFFGAGQPWSQPGGQEGVDYVGNVSSVEFIETEDTYLFDATPRLISDVQSWVDNPAANHGWMLITFSEDTRYTARRWGSREDPFDPPLLTVTFTPVPEPSTLALAGLGVLAFLLWKRFPA